MADLAPPDFTVDFSAVKVDDVFAGAAFQAFIDAGTQLHTIPLVDIDIFVPLGEQPPYSLKDLLSWGNRVGDCVFFMQIYEADRDACGGDVLNNPCRFYVMLTHDPAKSLKPPMSPDHAAKLVAAWAIYAMVRAGPPSLPVPKFIKDQIGVSMSPKEMCDSFTLTNPVNWSLEWIRAIKWSTVGRETLSRFGLGVAGYRLIQPFKIYTPKADSKPNIIAACETMRLLAGQGATWEVHPVTRNPNLLTALGNLNKNCMNLMMEAFTSTEMAEMKGNAISSAVTPVHDAQHVNYRSWTPALLNTLTFTQIF